MPIHEYRCLSCGEVGEFLVGMGEKSDPLVCKKCGKKGFERLLSATSFTMKGPKAAGSSSARCCGSSEPRGDCTPGTCCGSNK
jgi:putative FmdB family regulatory protein